MIKEAIKYFTQLGIQPDERVVTIVDTNGNNRDLVIDNDGHYKEIKSLITRAEDQLTLNTLTGLVAYVKANLERRDQSFYLHIHDEKTVYLKGLLDSDGGRNP